MVSFQILDVVLLLHVITLWHHLQYSHIDFGAYRLAPENNLNIEF